MCTDMLTAAAVLLSIPVLYTPSRHRACLATVTDLPGNIERVEKGGGSVVPKISNQASVIKYVVPCHFLNCFSRRSCPTSV